MAAFEIAKSSSGFSFPKRKSQKKPDYLAWLHTLPCVITGNMGVEAAHLSYSEPRYGHYGRARGTKTSDRWALPMAKPHHDRQHSMNERDFWEEWGTNPHVLCLTLWGLYTEMGDAATEYATAVIYQEIVSR